MATVLKVNLRHRQTALEFEEWLEDNPNASTKRKFGTFDAIADKKFNELKKPKNKVKKAKKVKKDNSVKRI